MATVDDLRTATWINPTIDSQTLRDLVNPVSPNDYYSLSLDSSANLSLSLQSLSADANLQLLNSQGEVVRSSTNSGTTPETLDLTLTSGVYYIQVTLATPNTATNYSLQIATQTNPLIDLVWRDVAGGLNYIWFMGGANNNTAIGGTPLPTVDPTWQMEAVADFNTDGIPDLLWREYSLGTNYIWYLGDQNYSEPIALGILPTVDPIWQLDTVADFNHDGALDLVWRNYTSGDTAIWFMGGTDGTTALSATFLPVVSPNWRIEGAVDFDRNGTLDIVWQNSTSPEVYVWFMGGVDGLTAQTFAALPSLPTNWQVEGVLDMNRDGSPDLVWRDYTSGTNIIFFLGGPNNTALIGSANFAAVSSNWQLFPTIRSGRLPNQNIANAEILGTVWNDVDGDGIQETGELGLANRVVYLDQNQNGQLDTGERSTPTTADGSYRFTGLAAGNYAIAQTLPPGWQSTAPNLGPSRVLQLNPSEIATDVNFGSRALLSSLSLNLSQQASGFTNPVHITHAGDGSDRLFVVEQPGQIRIIQNGALLPTPFLDIRNIVAFGGEQGLLSVAFPPNFAEKQYFYVYYTNQAGNLVIARYRVTANSNVADPASGQTILTIEHPGFDNHNGGQLAFGPDGFLYIATGDGGGGGDPNNNAQNPNSLLGKVLRIDVETPGTATYTIPSTNPFVAATDPLNGVRDEIWALGLRNPWRFSFDRTTGDLYIADVGQNQVEEVNFQPASSLGGQNYGWRILEGTRPYLSNGNDTAGLTPPVVEYEHAQGRSITGGYVYRGLDTPALQGVYLYGDFINGRLWGLRRTATGWENRLLQDSPYGVSTFGEDVQGNLYLADYFGGTIYKLSA